MQGVHFQEAERAAMMFSGLGHAVDFVLVDDGVLSMLEGSGYSFGLRKLSRVLGIDGLRTYYLESSARVRTDARADGFAALTDGQFAEMLLGSKVVVF